MVYVQVGNIAVRQLNCNIVLLFLSTTKKAKLVVRYFIGTHLQGEITCLASHSPELKL